MAFKRTATTELNHDNWDKDEKSEEAGIFTKAPEEVLEKRVVKTARRRIQNSGDVSLYHYNIFNVLEERVFL